jgi:hypothetical protein
MKKLFLTLLLLVGFAMFNPANATELPVNIAPTENVISVEDEDVIIIVDVITVELVDEDGNVIASETYVFVTIIIIE